jgi:hypothetical protein
MHFALTHFPLPDQIPWEADWKAKTFPKGISIFILSRG